MPQIVSTLSSSVDYTGFVTGGSAAAKRKQVVTVRGGANVAQKRLVLVGEGETSHAGVRTTVSDEDLAFLMDHKLFQTHMKNGHVKVLTFTEKANKVAKDMAIDDDNGRGGSAPLTIKDTKKGGRIEGAKLEAPKVE